MTGERRKNAMRPVPRQGRAASYGVRSAFLLLDRYGDDALDALLERDEGLGGDYALYALHLVVEQVHELLIVAGIEFDEHGVRTGGEVAFHDLGDLEELLDNLLVHAAALKVESDVGTGGVADALRVDTEAAAGDDAALDEVLHALVDGRTRHAAGCRYVLEGYSCVLGKNAENLSVEIVDFVHVCIFF